MIYSIQHSEKGLIQYEEPKRWLWSLVVFFILIPLPVMYVFVQTGNSWLLITPLLITYLLLPSLDLLIGTDKHNPPEELVSKMEACLLYTSPSPRDLSTSRMPSSA